MDESKTKELFLTFSLMFLPYNVYYREIHVVPETLYYASDEFMYWG